MSCWPLRIAPYSHRPSPAPPWRTSSPGCAPCAVCATPPFGCISRSLGSTPPGWRAAAACHLVSRWRRCARRWKRRRGGAAGGCGQSAVALTISAGALLGYYSQQLAEMPKNIARAHQRRLVLLRNQALMHTLYATAGRVAEVASLQRADVAEGRATQAEIVGKGNRRRFIFLTAPAQHAIQAYLRERDDSALYLFVSHGPNVNWLLSPQAIWQIVNNAAKGVYGTDSKGAASAPRRAARLPPLARAAPFRRRDAYHFTPGPSGPCQHFHHPRHLCSENPLRRPARRAIHLRARSARCNRAGREGRRAHTLSVVIFCFGNIACLWLSILLPGCAPSAILLLNRLHFSLAKTPPCQARRGPRRDDVPSQSWPPRADAAGAGCSTIDPVDLT